MRIYNPSLGRFLSVDPLTKTYPELTPYQFASNDPIESIDADGLERVDFRTHMAIASNSGAPALGLFTYAVDWFTSPLVGFAEASMANAANNYQYRTPSGYTQNVPDQVRDLRYNVIDLKTKLEATANAIEFGNRAQTVQGALMFAHGALSLRANTGNIRPIGKTSPSKIPASTQASANAGQNGKGGLITIIVDENLPPSLVKDLNNEGFNAVMFKKGTSDATIIEFAKQTNSAILTNNVKDFLKQDIPIIKVTENMKKNPNLVVDKMKNLAENVETGKTNLKAKGGVSLSTQ